MAGSEYKNVGTHPIDLASGLILAVGETAVLDKDAVRDPHNEALLADGVLIGTEDKAEHEAELAERRVSSRIKKTEGGEE